MHARTAHVRSTAALIASVVHRLVVEHRKVPEHVTGPIDERQSEIALGTKIDQADILWERCLQVVRVIALVAGNHELTGRPGDVKFHVVDDAIAAPEGERAHARLGWGRCTRRRTRATRRAPAPTAARVPGKSPRPWRTQCRPSPSRSHRSRASGRRRRTRARANDRRVGLKESSHQQIRRRVRM